jgi:hypothetical protein
MTSVLLVAATFFAVWAGFTVFARKKGWSWVTGVGGGFLVSVIVIPVAVGIVESIPLDKNRRQ